MHDLKRKGVGKQSRLKPFRSLFFVLLGACLIVLSIPLEVMEIGGELDELENNIFNICVCTILWCITLLILSKDEKERDYSETSKFIRGLIKVWNKVYEYVMSSIVVFLILYAVSVIWHLFS